MMWLILTWMCLSVVLGEENANKEPELKYTKPFIGDLAAFAEPFHSTEEFSASWQLSEAKKDGVEDAISKYNGEWAVKEPKENPLVGDKGLVFMSEAKHGAVSSLLKEPFKFEDKPLIVQYEVKFQNKQECGGAYVKLLAESPSLDLKQFTDKTEYSIMFGPDKCGGDGKIHFIFQHKNPISHKMEEKHAKKGSGDFNYIFDDGKTHLLTLIVRPDNSFEIQIDKKKVNEGSLLKDMEPPVNPPKEIDDPDDKKPEEWDEREKIPDPAATKPDDWDEDAPKTISDSNAVKPDGWLDDEPELIPDPEAVRPEDWDDEEDGEWEAPQVNNPKCKAVGCGEWKAPIIKNPDYKGKWTPPLIANPKYKGIWKPRRIENPEFFEDNNPFSMKAIAAVGFELWSMQADIMFDNILIADDLSTVQQWTAQTWDVKNSKEVADTPSAVHNMMTSFLTATEEKPWLWVVVVAAVLLPVLLIYFCCFTGGKDDKVSQQKKTDEPVPDDEPTVEESENRDSASEKSADESTEPKIEEIIEESNENVEVKKKEEEEVKEPGDQKEDGETAEEEKLDTNEEVQPSPTATRTRRKTRKDN